MNRKAQEEMVGFALIVVIVAVAMLFLLVFYIRSDGNDGLESYKVESFIQSALHYTSDCGNYLGLYSVQNLIYKCSENSICSDGRSACEALNSTLSEICDSSWDAGEDRPVKGYEMKIISGQSEILSVEKGNKTGEFLGSSQSLPESVEITFRAYYS